MATKFRINRGEWIDVPEGYVLLKGEAIIKEGDMCYHLGKFQIAKDIETWMSIGDFGYSAVIRQKENLRPDDAYFVDGSLVESMDNPRKHRHPYTIFKLADPDYEEKDRLRALAEEVDPRFSNYKLDVRFRPNPRGGSFEALFASGSDTMGDCFEPEEHFAVEKGYTASYTVLDESENVVTEGTLLPGRYRFHNGFVEKRNGLDWLKPKRFRH